jgi:uncharacterized integral membrane protein
MEPLPDIQGLEPSSQSPPPDAKTRGRSLESKPRGGSKVQIAKLVGLLALAGFAGAFIFQNSQNVSVHLWFVDRPEPLIIVVLACLVLGLLIGFLAGFKRGKLSQSKTRWWRRGSKSPKI